MSGSKKSSSSSSEELSLGWRGMRQYRPDLVGMRNADGDEDAARRTKAKKKKYAKIKTLDLSHNELSGVCSFLTVFPALETLVLDHNRFSSTTTFPTHYGLRTLSLNNNRITSLPTIIGSIRAAFPNLRHLSLLGNDACPNYFNGGTAQEYANYRLYVASAIPELTLLDDSPITDSERAEGNRVYGSLQHCVPLGVSAKEADKNLHGSSSLQSSTAPTVKRSRRSHRSRAHPERSSEEAEHHRTKTDEDSDDGDDHGEKRKKTSKKTGHETLPESDSDWTSGEEL